MTFNYSITRSYHLNFASSPYIIKYTKTYARCRYNIYILSLRGNKVKNVNFRSRNIRRRILCGRNYNIAFTHRISSRRARIILITRRIVGTYTIIRLYGFLFFLFRVLYIYIYMYKSFVQYRL